MYTPAGSNTNAVAPQVYNIGGPLVVSFNTDDDKDALVIISVVLPRSLPRMMEDTYGKQNDGVREWCLFRL